MPREFTRSDRVASQIQREMAELIRTQVNEPGLGMVTISEVELSRDLAVAKIFVTFLGNQKPPKDCVKALADYVPTLRRELGKRLRVRVLPEIRFAFDDSIERGLRMDALLHRISQETPERDGNDGQEDA
ncbi:30S ribosome-binding factor RbfA [Methylomagnum ishizawai]|uniref:30S ribosome-binding factor RbfA n=1 Tax=Methylomagnum ishizawai TaxID=1760988 RepID=UPI001C329D35|nr:30S ribosome-binding factor RbfA [Methylomagnum ishizawai]BBL76301.1 ribosome-binding factor A [Methylomagnum ishizawai]